MCKYVEQQIDAPLSLSLPVPLPYSIPPSL